MIRVCYNCRQKHGETDSNCAEVIAIAHRLSTIKGYDEICVLQNGTIVAKTAHLGTVMGCDVHDLQKTPDNRYYRQ